LHSIENWRRRRAGSGVGERGQRASGSLPARVYQCFKGRLKVLPASRRQIVRTRIVWSCCQGICLARSLRERTERDVYVASPWHPDSESGLRKSHFPGNCGQWRGLTAVAPTLAAPEASPRRERRSGAPRRRKAAPQRKSWLGR